MQYLLLQIEQAPADDDDDNDDIVEEDAAMMDEEVYFEEPSRLEASVSIDASAHNIIHAQIDPIAWKTELERVGPKLRAQTVLTSNEWRAHVDQTVTTKGQIEKLMGDSSGEIFAMNKYV